MREAPPLARTAAVAAALLLAVACATVGPPGEPEAAPARADRTRLGVAPRSVRFDDTFVRCVRSAPLRLRNRSTDSVVTVTEVVSGDPAVSFSAELPLTLEPGERFLTDLRFAPDAPGELDVEIELVTDEAEVEPPRLKVRARALEAAAPPAAEPLDLVFVIDVSTTMAELGGFRRAVQDLFALVEGNRLDARFGLATFENDVRVHRNGAFLGREAFLDELDSQLVEGSWVPDPELPRQLLNFELAENSLDALHRAATDFEWRSGARHVVFLVTDGTFLDPPAVYSDGTRAIYSYEEVSEALRAHGIQLLSVHSRDHARGLSDAYAGRPALVELTGGSWYEIAKLGSGRLKLDALLGEVVAGRSCRLPSEPPAVKTPADPGEAPTDPPAEAPGEVPGESVS